MGGGVENLKAIVCFGYPEGGRNFNGDWCECGKMSQKVDREAITFANEKNEGRMLRSSYGIVRDANEMRMT